MATPFLGALISGALLCALIALFRFEYARGERFLERFRAELDRLVDGLGRRLRRWAAFFGGGVARETTHYLFHKLLQFLLRVLRAAERRVNGLIRRNKNVARRVRGEEKTARTTLDEIADHKAATALSDEEKRRKREETLEG